MEEKEVKEQPAQQAEKAKTKKKDNNLQKKIDELSDKLSREHDDYLRLMAEFDTYRRRTAEEKLSLVSSAAADTIKGLLPVLDDCESALKILEGSSDAAAREGAAKFRGRPALAVEHAADVRGRAAQLSRQRPHALSTVLCLQSQPPSFLV